MELIIGRSLTREEHIHHIDENGLNNSISNLEIINGRLHNSIHTRERNLKHDPNNFVCSTCNLKTLHKARGLCDNCWAKIRRKETTKRPCSICGSETINSKTINGICASCSINTFSSCTICNRSKDTLPKSIRINSAGLS